MDTEFNAETRDRHITSAKSARDQEIAKIKQEIAAIDIKIDRAHTRLKNILATIERNFNASVRQYKQTYGDPVPAQHRAGINRLDRIAEQRRNAVRTRVETRVEKLEDQIDNFKKQIDIAYRYCDHLIVEINEKYQAWLESKKKSEAFC